MEELEGESLYPHHIIARHLFCLGKVKATILAVQATIEADVCIKEMLDHYVQGGWPKQTDAALQANQRAVVEGGTISVTYTLHTGVKIRFSTNTERTLTLIVLVSEL